MNKLSKRIKKGFTLVELLVVIAIIAILAAVSVVGYLSFTDKAKESVDEQAVTQMNVALEAQEAIDAPDNVEEAKDVLKNAGFNVDDYVPLDKDSIFYYDEIEMKVLIYDQVEQKVTFPKNLAEKYSNFTDGNKPGTWYVLNDKTYEWVSMETATGSNAAAKLINALKVASDYQIVQLTEDVSVAPNMNSVNGQYATTMFASNTNGVARIDLNGHVMNLTTNSFIGGEVGMYANAYEFNQTIYIRNGKINGSSRTASFTVGYGSSLTLNDVEYINTNTDDKEKNSFIVNENSNLTIENSIIKNEIGDTASVYLAGKQSQTNIFNSTLVSTTYGITTNASGNLSWDVVVNMKNSSLTCLNGPAVLVNVPGVYNFSNCVLQGNGQGVVIRGGNAKFDTCTIVESGDNVGLLSSVFSDMTSWEFSDVANQINDSPFKPNGLWSSGNMMQFGGLILGDWASSYDYDTSCTLINTSIYMKDSWNSLPIVYLSQDSGNKTTLIYDANCKFYSGDVETSSDVAIKQNSASSIEGVIQKGTIVVEKKD